MTLQHLFTEQYIRITRDSYFLLSSRPSGEGAKKKGFPNIQGPIQTLPEFLAVCDGKFDAVLAMLGEDMARNQLDQLYQVMGTLPQVEVNMEVKGWWEGGEGQQEARKVNKAHTGKKLHSVIAGIGLLKCQTFVVE